MPGIDSVGTLGADRVAGLENHHLMKSDHIWSALAGEIAALKKLVNEQKAKHNALLAKLDADTGVAGTDYAATQSVTAADSKL